MSTQQQQQQQQQEEATKDLTQEEQKKMVRGQCSYLLLMLLSLAAFILSQNATIDCNFAKRSIQYTNGFTADGACSQAAGMDSFDEQSCRTFLGDHGVGFHYWMGTIPVNQKVCLSYTMFIPEVGWITPTFDAAFNAARVFAIMANIFGAFGWCYVLFATCCPISQERVKGLSCYFTFACICQSFTFLIYGSNICNKGFFQQYFPTMDVNHAIQDVTCSLGTGGNRSLAAAVLYAVCSFLAIHAIAPAPVRYRGRTSSPDDDTQEEEQPYDPEAPNNQQP